MGTTAATLYLRSGACLPTRYPMSGHLLETHERDAIGADPLVEIDYILDGHPPIITMDEVPRPEEDMALRRDVLARISRHYDMVERVPTAKNAVLVYLPKGRQRLN